MARSDFSGPCIIGYGSSPSQNGLQFDDAVRRLSDEFNDRLMFKYFGPVPPYNFVNIVVNWEG